MQSRKSFLLTVATGSWAAKPRAGSASPLEKHTDFLLALIEEQPDLTLDEIVCAMASKGCRQSQTASRVIKRHDITFEKGLRAAAQELRRRGAGASAPDA